MMEFLAVPKGYRFYCLAAGALFAANAVRADNLDAIPSLPAPHAEVAASQVLEPEYVRELSPLEAGRNDSNPVWSLANDLIAIERSQGDKREIVIVRSDGTEVEKIYFQLSVMDAKTGKENSFFMLP